MKTISILLSLFVIAVSANQHPFFSDERLVEVIKISKECIGETNVKQEALNKWRSGELLDDPDLKEYIACTFLKLGFVDEKGTVNLETLKKDLGRSEIALNAISQCYDKRGNSPTETAYDVYKCFKGNLPAKFKGGL
nr:uncharacterized protein LOC111427684 [Onthophagus taurus]